MFVEDPYTNRKLEVGDMVQHPVTGHVGLITGKSPTEMWVVEWFANNLKGWSMLKKTLRTVEYDSTLHLMAKAENA